MLRQSDFTGLIRCGAYAAFQFFLNNMYTYTLVSGSS